MGFVVTTLFCALVAIGLWVYGRRARRDNEHLRAQLAKLIEARHPGLVVPPGMQYVPITPADPPPPPGMDPATRPVAAYRSRRQPEGVWVVAGTWSEQPVEVVPSAAAAELLAYWMSCDEVCVTHEVRYLSRGETNPIAPQVNRRVKALAAWAVTATVAGRLEALPPGNPLAPLPPEVVEKFRRDFADLQHRRQRLEADMHHRNEP
jgi:hypothetical protein